ncbi:hypothetical protein [Paraliomyxa miuraensis]|uniref:hypothetical protein n=1 Tax=Paraliomyxa miuraensis TaxID=376150 RepID=UPI00225B8260|nr:hypothetical protein [Paraliomyxa miuraensis]MCX4241235.1 hypothetical protein [Paraliomyxa miuraensis]
MRWFLARGHGRWRLVGARTLALVLPLAPCGCSDDDGFFDDGSDTTEGYVEPMVDYSGCERAMRDSPCGMALCGTSAEAQDYLQLMLDVVRDAGHSSRFSPTVAEYYALTNELRIDYQLQVGWFRVANTLSLSVPATDDLLRDELEAHVDTWVIPSSVVPPEDITDEVEACHALLTYDPCQDHQLDFTVHASYDWEQPDCVYKTTYALVDADNGSTLDCVVEQELPCE